MSKSTDDSLLASRYSTTSKSSLDTMNETNDVQYSYVAEECVICKMAQYNINGYMNRSNVSTLCINRSNSK